MERELSYGRLLEENKKLAKLVLQGTSEEVEALREENAKLKKIQADREELAQLRSQLLGLKVENAVFKDKIRRIYDIARHDTFYYGGILKIINPDKPLESYPNTGI